jgi:hypothetical protein
MSRRVRTAWEAARLWFETLLYLALLTGALALWFGLGWVVAEKVHGWLT